MKTRQYIMALDQGTTGSTCLIFNSQLQVVSRAYQEVHCSYPQPGWVSQVPEELWASTQVVMRQALREAGLNAGDLAALGITNQRETTVIWERSTGRPIYDGIVWQCRRTAPIVEKWVQQGLSEMLTAKTGLLPDAYFSASKIAYILDEVPGARARAQRGELAFGTVDTWLLWKLSGGRVHATEPSNASRTMLCNIHTQQWDEELLRVLDIPESLLPQILPTTAHFTDTYPDLLGQPVPITGIAGDQQAALFGQCCFNKGDIKNTYGTGCFLVMNTGTTPFRSQNRLLTTIAWQLDGQTHYALEGSVFSAGSAVQWLRDGLGIIRSASQTEEMATSLKDNGGVYLIPAFSGLGAPYWDPYALATISGITRDTRPEHFVRAALEASAYQCKDLVQAMASDCQVGISTLRVDGGMTVNNFLMQFQADILDAVVERPCITDSTALGAAALAGYGQGMFTLEQLQGLRQVDRSFNPSMSAHSREQYYSGWRRAIARTLS